MMSINTYHDNRVMAIVQANNAAVSLLMDMRLRLAAKLLNRAISDVQAFSLEDGMDEGEEPGDDGCDCMDLELPFRASRLPSKVRIRAIPIPVPQTIDKCTSLSSYLPYWKALVLDLPHDEQGNSELFQTEDEQSLLACIMFYNLGLCFQFSALSLGKEKCWSKSLVSYEAALGLLGRSEDSSLVLLELALLNNSGYIYQTLFDSTSAESSLDQMRLIFDDITECGEEPLPTNLTCFFLNAEHNENLSSRAAPMA